MTRLTLNKNKIDKEAIDESIIGADPDKISVETLLEKWRNVAKSVPRMNS